ncbi:MAG: hypothetical protein AAGD07_14515 [Planctomycetota bacterium]
MNQRNDEAPDTSGEDKAAPTRRQHLEFHLRTRPADREGYLELATIYREENRPLNAARILEQAHEIFPDDSTVLWEWEEAQLARSVQQLVEVRDLAERLRNPAADQELERAKVDWANCRLRVCRQRLQRDPSMDYLRLVIGEALYDSERYEEAVEELMTLSQSDDHSPAAFLLMGRCQLVLSRDMDAMKSLRAASMRRAVVGAPKIRAAALKLLCDLADRHGLTATLEQYRNQLEALGGLISNGETAPTSSPEGAS